MAGAGTFEQHVLLTGMHCGDGQDLAVARRELPACAVVHRAGAALGGEDAKSAAAAMARIAAAAATVIAAVDPAAILAIGDRLDLLPAIAASVPFNVPIVHVHGGELTFGALDDRVRHAITKLAHLHCVANVDAARRVSSMGEETWRIALTGGPGLDRLAAAPAADPARFAADLELPSIDGLRLVTVHAETNGCDPLAPARAVLAALSHDPLPILITASNDDMGGRAVNEHLRAFAGKRPSNVRLRDTLGADGYAAALRLAAVVIGNSSSGIVEAGLFGTPVVNVGDRQAGRIAGLNVTHVPADGGRVRAAIEAAAGRRYNPADTAMYGDGKAAGRIVALLADLPERARLVRKVFANASEDFTAPWVGGGSARLKTIAAAESSGAIATSRSIADDLARLGVCAGDTVLVHSSLKALGFVVGGVRGVIEALLAAVGPRGTIMMPSFSGDISDPGEWKFPPVPPAWVDTIRREMPIFDSQLTPTRRMGAIPEYFRSWPGTQRSPHPQSSFVAFGPRAAELVREHPLAYRFGPAGPLGAFERLGGKVLLLGAPYNTSSLLYLTDYDRAARREVTCSYPLPTAGGTAWFEASDIVYSDHWFEGAIKHLEASGVATVGNVGAARSVLYPAREGLAAVRAWRSVQTVETEKQHVA